MKIAEIETLPVSVGPGYKYAVIIVLVRTDEGLTGIFIKLLLWWSL